MSSLPKIAYPIFTLELPTSGRTIKYRPFLVKEDKLLLLAKMSSETKDMIMAVKQILTNCILEDDIDVDELPIVDIEYIFLSLRAKSIGEDITIKFAGKENTECPECRRVKVAHVNLNNVKVTKSEGHIKEIKIDDQIGITMKYPTFREQLKLETQNMDDPQNLLDVLLTKIANGIESIFEYQGEQQIFYAKDSTREELVDFIEGLPQEALEKIDQFFTTSPKIRHVVDLSCASCGLKEEYILEGLESFFV
jgi:hypothetical protein